MAEIIQGIQRVAEQVEHVQLDGHLAVTTAVATLGIVAAKAMVRSYDSNQAERISSRHANPDLINRTFVDSATGTSLYDKEVRRTRLMPAASLLVGGGLLLSSYIGHPNSYTVAPNNDAGLVIVDDMSSSMRLTKDVSGTGQSRSSVLHQAIYAANYPGLLGVVQTAAGDPTISLPLKRDWKSGIVTATRPEVDPNGGQMARAIDLAASLLPMTDQGHRNGTVEVISDGTIDDTPEAMAAEAAKLKKLGVIVRAIVPGTASGAYRLQAGTPNIQSGSLPKSFEAFSQGTVKTVSSIAAANKAIATDFQESSTKRLPTNWPLPAFIGTALLAFGVGRVSHNVATRH